MNQFEKRIIASLILLLALTLLTIALNTNQIETVINLLKRIFEPAIAGT